jgi:hypothetical protein
LIFIKEQSGWAIGIRIYTACCPSSALPSFERIWVRIYPPANRVFQRVEREFLHPVRDIKDREMRTKLEHTFSALFCLPTNSEKVNALALLYSMAECNVKFALVVHSSGSLSLWLFSIFTKFCFFFFVFFVFSSEYYLRKVAVKRLFSGSGLINLV